jgi:peptide chain release factor 2
VKQLSIFGGGFDLASKLEKLAELEKITMAPGFWDDTPKAQGIMSEMSALRDEVSEWQELEARLTDALELAGLQDPEMESDLSTEAQNLSALVGKLEFRTLFSGNYDKESAILAIHAGAGGTEAQDWAQMLQRMFVRWAESKSFEVEVIDESPGEEAGLKSTLMSITGRYAYGRLRSERGVHRLVRISPYDSSSRRHTSFAKVEVWPNETAIRITHLPTGLVVSCQNQRSLTQNLEMAMKVLKTQLFDLERRKQEEEMAALKGEDVDAGWGNQIRSYVLHPYKMVKDHRTNYEVGNAQAVLDGVLDGFMEAFLRYSVGEPVA